MPLTSYSIRNHLYRADLVQYAFPEFRCLVFAKAPVAGQAKTRLIPALGAAGAAGLQACLTRATVERLATAALSPLTLWAAPDTEHPLFQQLRASHELTLARQCDGDLGQRMLHACRQCRAEACVLLGTDCPGLDADVLRQALVALRQNDAVMIPALDGGYVLLGLRRAEPGLFDAMPWGGSEVAALTRARMRRLGWRWAELAPLRDLDRPEDLTALRAQVEAMNCERAVLRA